MTIASYLLLAFCCATTCYLATRLSRLKRQLRISCSRSLASAIESYLDSECCGFYRSSWLTDGRLSEQQTIDRYLTISPEGSFMLVEDDPLHAPYSTEFSLSLNDLAASDWRQLAETPPFMQEQGAAAPNSRSRGSLRLIRGGAPNSAP